MLNVDDTVQPTFVTDVPDTRPGVKEREGPADTLTVNVNG